MGTVTRLASSKSSTSLWVEDAQVEYCLANEQIVGLEMNGVIDDPFEFAKGLKTFMLVMAEYPFREVRFRQTDLLVLFESSSEVMEWVWREFSKAELRKHSVRFILNVGEVTSNAEGVPVAAIEDLRLIVDRTLADRDV